jgi:hypothetical protein
MGQLAFSRKNATAGLNSAVRLGILVVITHGFIGLRLIVIRSRHLLSDAGLLSALADTFCCHDF